MGNISLQTVHGPVDLEAESGPWITLDAGSARLHCEPMSLELDDATVALYLKDGAVVFQFSSESAAAAALEQIRGALPRLPVESFPDLSLCACGDPACQEFAEHHFELAEREFAQALAAQADASTTSATERSEVAPLCRPAPEVSASSLRDEAQI